MTFRTVICVNGEMSFACAEEGSDDEREQR
jgi:hypothetical protein